MQKLNKKKNSKKIKLYHVLKLNIAEINLHKWQLMEY